MTYCDNRGLKMNDKCFSCKNSYNDTLEGWNCKKFDAVIILSGGSFLNWPGQSCVTAFDKDCKGEGFDRSIIPGVVCKYPLLWTVVASVLLSTLITAIFGIK